MQTAAAAAAVVAVSEVSKEFFQVGDMDKVNEPRHLWIPFFHSAERLIILLSAARTETSKILSILSIN